MNRSDYQAGLKESRKLRPATWLASLELGLQIFLTVVAVFMANSPFSARSILGEALLFCLFWRWFSIFHTAAHRAYFISPLANEAVGLIASVFAFLPFHAWRASHIAHHRWNGWHGLDPTLDFPARSEAPPSLKTIMDLAWRWHIPFFSLYFIVGKLWKQSEKVKIDSEPRSAERVIPLSAAVLVLGHLALFLFLGAWGYFRVFPLPFLAYLVTSDIVLLSQHSNFEQLDPGRASKVSALHPIAHLEHTRSVLLPEPVSRHVFLRFDWHELHHLYPSVPHYRLHRLRLQLPELPNEIQLGKWLGKNSGTPGHILALPELMGKVNDLEYEVST